ncbi:MFS transporter [Psychromarinibacter sp. C21-152]|uniref:MFS transporter n=1 Tax=Psychromarinibacter sediminicola TaxID=3033385 RepID=A0AAE3NPC7_9RHOB|nr:MFS transporter [Psychromarinibacter sediminicola]MDF0599547.1 MFS transporter [Psychromarinibacter sediminicola]
MPAKTPRLSQPEFIGLTAMIIASVAFAVDSMLPAMNDIAAELSPDAPNQAQLIITSFVLGMGAGTLFTGPLSDTFGRRPVIFGGFAIYFAGALLAWAAPSLELVLLARLLQGLGAAGPRVAVLALVRDQFEGRRMAQIMSFVMMVFTLVPAAAPLVGTAIIAVAGWRGIFFAYMIWAIFVCTWFGLRQPETLPQASRRPFHPGSLMRGTVEILTNRTVALTIAVLALVFGMLFATLSTIQPMFDVTFDAAGTFPYWFAGISLVAAGASFLNARVVVRLGMRLVVRITLTAQLVLSLSMAGIVITGLLSGTAYFAAFLFWIQTMFFMLGLTIGNLNALGMEPLGHLAGLGASVISAVATVSAVVIAVPIGLAFDGTPLSLAAGTALCCALALALMRPLGTGEEDTA